MEKNRNFLKPEAVEDWATGGTENFAAGLAKRTAEVLLRAEEYGVAATTTCWRRLSAGTLAILIQAFRHLPYTVQANVTLILRSHHYSLFPNPFQISHSSAIHHSQLYSFRYRHSLQLFDLRPLQQMNPVHLAIKVRTRVILVSSLALTTAQRA